jgi:hypothetical protein
MVFIASPGLGSCGDDLALRHPLTAPVAHLLFAPKLGGLPDVEVGDMLHIGDNIVRDLIDERGLRPCEAASACYRHRSPSAIVTPGALEGDPAKLEQQPQESCGASRGGRVFAELAIATWRCRAMVLRRAPISAFDARRSAARGFGSGERNACQTMRHQIGLPRRRNCIG